MSWLYSQALVAEYSAAKCSAGEPCAPSSSTPSPLGHCLPDKMTAVSKLSRYGMTFAPLTADRGEALLTWFLAGFPARTFPAPAKGRASMASDQDSGLNSLASLARYDPATRSWKTPQYSLLGESIEFSETWPKWGFMRDGVVWQQPRLAPSIKEKGSGLWATPTTMDTLPPKSSVALTREATTARPGRSRPGNLRDQISNTDAWETITNSQPATPDLWRTPDANMASGGASNALARKEQDHAVSLADQVNTPEVWPTPITSDGRGGVGPRKGATNLNLRTAVAYHTPRANDGEKRGNLADDPRNGLPAQVQQHNWPTPKALDAEKGPSQGELLRNSPTLAAMVAVVPTPTVNDAKNSTLPPSQASHDNLPGYLLRDGEKPGGQLNPDWVEWLMGWPVGWTAPVPLASAEILPWDHEPADVPRVGHRIPARAPRLKCIGNGQVPYCAAMAFLILSEGFNHATQHSDEVNPGANTGPDENGDPALRLAAAETGHDFAAGGAVDGA